MVVFETLSDICKHAAARIAEGATQWRSPFHAPVVATADARARVIVLRQFDPEGWTLRFNTDARAPKTRMIEEMPQMGVLFYDPAAKLQVRLHGQARIQAHGEEADAAWAAATRFARRCYLGDVPGAGCDGPSSGLPAEVEGIEPDDAQLLPARENFAVILFAARELDVLRLAHTGHRRARFTLPQGEGCWIAP